MLFVCTGNTCRSPMAEVLLRHELAKNDALNHVKVSSAGIFASLDAGASPGSIKALKTRRIDLSEHKSKQLTQAMLDESDLVLTMTRSHADFIKQNFRSKNVYTLKEFVGEIGDINDPFGGSDEEYEVTAKQLETLIKEVVRLLKREDDKCKEK